MSGNLYDDDGALDQQVEEMISAAERGFGNDVPVGQRMLDGLVVLSALVSALFFLLYGRQVFKDLWDFLAVIMTLLCGLMPTEYAYIAWRNIRKQKQRMTQAQLTFSGMGIAFAVGFAVFSTIAMFVAGFPQVPETIRQYSGWFVFIALSLPLPIQFAMIAGFELFDRAVAENHSKAKAHAITFDALQRFNLARLGAALIGMRRQLSRELGGYGAETGGRGAAHLLGRKGDAPVFEDELLEGADVSSLLPAGLGEEERPSFRARFRRKAKKAAPDVPDVIDGEVAPVTPVDDAPRQEAPAPVAAGMTMEQMLLFAQVLRDVLGVPFPSAEPHPPHPNGQETKPDRPS